MTSRFLITADDLTGANDVAVQFVKSGVPAAVAVSWQEALPGNAWSAPVLVVNTESRHVSPLEAARRVGCSVRAGAIHGATHFYKKTDSTLRGNVGAELAALLRETGREALMFVPAFPSAGRTTLNGIQYVNGVPLARSDFGKDPLEPALESSVSAVLRSQTDLPVSEIRLADLRTPGLSLAGVRGIAVFDAQEDGDLRFISELLRRNGALSACAGPAAFAAFLPPQARMPRQPIPVSPSDTPVLVVNGSLNAVALAQVRAGLAQGMSGVSARGVDDEEATRRAASLLREGRDCMVYSVAALEELGTGGSQTPSHEAHAARMGRIAASVVDAAAVRNLAVFGGDTSLAVLKALGVGSMWPKRELEPGATLSTAEAGGGRLSIVTKSGGFGGQDIVTTVVEYLRRGSDPRRHHCRSFSR